MITEDIKQLIKTSIKSLNLPEVDFNLDHPASESHGDYATNVALILFPQVQGFANPHALAEAIVAVLNRSVLLGTGLTCQQIFVAGPGFINFTLSHSWLLSQASHLDFPKTKQRKTVIVEYSSPNIAKPFTIGHLRSTIIGSAIANLFEAIGWPVLRDNHLGDWGTQFGKLIYAIKTWGDEIKIDQASNPVKELVLLYVKYHQEAELNPELDNQARMWFKKLETHDPEAQRLWKRCISWSWTEFARIYQLLDIHFSSVFDNGRGLGESFLKLKCYQL